MNIHKNTSVKEMEAFTSDCERCGECCKRGSGFAVDEDIQKIAQYYNQSVEEVKKDKFDAVTMFGTTRYRPKLIKKDEDHVWGRCVFLQQDNTCKIHDIKPLQCRVVRGKGPKAAVSFDWFLVNYFLDVDSPSSIREWAIRLEVNPTQLHGAQIEDIVPDEEIRKKIFDYTFGKEVKNE